MLAWIKQLFGWGKSRNCPLCAERDFPTLDALTDHMRWVHSKPVTRVKYGKGPASVRNYPPTRLPRPPARPQHTREDAGSSTVNQIDPFALVPLAEAIFDSTPAIDTAPTSEPTQFEGFGGGESGGGGASGSFDPNS